MHVKWSKTQSTGQLQASLSEGRRVDDAGPASAGQGYAPPAADPSAPVTAVAGNIEQGQVDGNLAEGDDAS